MFEEKYKNVNTVTDNKEKVTGFLDIIGTLARGSSEARIAHTGSALADAIEAHNVLTQLVYL